MKKIIGLFVIACLVGIATFSFVKDNVDEATELSDAEQMGTDLALNPANKGTGKGDPASGVHFKDIGWKRSNFS